MPQNYLLNSPVLTSFGTFRYTEINLEAAQEMILSVDTNFISAIGHTATAQFLSQILGVEILANRIQIKMEPGDKALVFKIKERLPEGKILNEADLKNLAIEYGLLEHINA